MKAGYVAIIGKPNVGKSTLLNKLVGMKISAVTDKPQTTRHRILGILTEDEYQACFIDTPGVIKPEYELQELMVKQILTALADADVIVLMVDPWTKDLSPYIKIIQPERKIPVIVVINKIDLLPKPELLPLIDRLKNVALQEIVPVSALNGDGIDKLKHSIFKYLPESEFIYPDEDISDAPERFFVADLI